MGVFGEQVDSVEGEKWAVTVVVVMGGSVANNGASSLSEKLPKERGEGDRGVLGSSGMASSYGAARGGSGGPAGTGWGC